MKTKKLIYILPVILLCLFWASCKDNKDEFLSPNKLYFVHNGVQTLNMYNKGENTVYTYYLDLYKSGVLKNGAEAKIGIMSQQELDAYNVSNGTNYTLLEPGAYQIGNFDVTFSDDLKDVNRIINIRFYPSKLNPELKNKVLPIKIIHSSIEVNPDKSVCLINPQVQIPLVRIEMPQNQSINYTKGEQIVLDFDISTILDIDTNAADLNIEMELDQNYINQYNQQNQQDYQLPADNMFSFVKTGTMKAGTKKFSFNVKIFQQYLEKNYMLPIRLKSSSKFGVNRDQYYIIRLNVQSAILPTTKWTIAGFSSEEATGENNGANGKAIYLIDGNNNTFWHSKWQGAKPQPPHWVIIDLGEEKTVTSIGLRPRGAGNNAPTGGGSFYVTKTYVNGSTPNPINWQKIGDFTMNNTGDEQIFNMTTKIQGRYLWVNMTNIRSGDGTTSMAELRAFGY